MQKIAVNTNNLTERSITVFCNNKKVVKVISKRFLKASKEIQDRASSISVIIEILNTIIIEIYLEFQEGYLKIKQDETFQPYPGNYLIKEYDNEARAVRLRAIEEDIEEIDQILVITIIQNKTKAISDRAIREII